MSGRHKLSTSGTRERVREEEKKSFTLCRCHGTLPGNPKRLHQKKKKQLELIHEFSKVTGNKINIKKSVAFLYTNNEATEREIKESMPFTIKPITLKYVGINVTKEVKYLHAENYRKLMKEIEEDTK